MTTQAELLHLAKKHDDNCAVRALVLSIAEGQALTTQKHAAIEALIGVQKQALAGASGFRVVRDNSQLVAEAATAAAALTCIARDFTSLATILESLGENVCY